MKIWYSDGTMEHHFTHSWKGSEFCGASKIIMYSWLIRGVPKYYCVGSFQFQQLLTRKVLWVRRLVNHAFRESKLDFEQKPLAFERSKVITAVLLDYVICAWYSNPRNSIISVAAPQTYRKRTPYCNGGKFGPLLSFSVFLDNEHTWFVDSEKYVFSAWLLEKQFSSSPEEKLNEPTRF